MHDAREDKLSVLRRPICETDRMGSVGQKAPLALDPRRLHRSPEGGRSLAQLQPPIGRPLKADMPGLRGPEVAALHEHGAGWLRGGSAR